MGGFMQDPIQAYHEALAEWFRLKAQPFPRELIDGARSKADAALAALLTVYGPPATENTETAQPAKRGPGRPRKDV